VAGWWKNLEDSLEFLRTDCIDVYNVHGLNFEGYESSFAGDDGLYKQLLKAKEQGLIRFICHSFHGSCESLKGMVDTGLFDSITCQYNLLDRHLEEGIAYAHEKGEGVTIMGPVGGGRLGYPSDKAGELIKDVKSTPELALHFVLSNPNVTIALSGMSTMQMLEENVATASKAGELTQEDHDALEAAIQERKEFMGLYCTGCGYCMPCPEGVDIPANFEILNLERIFGLTDHAKSRYASLAGKAAYCRLCGKCVEPCPQDLDIPARLAEAVAVLDERAGTITGWSELRGATLDEGGLLEVDLRYHVKNFTDADEQVSIELQPHAEDQIDPADFSFEPLKAYGRRHKDLKVTVRPPLEALSLDAFLSFDGSYQLEHLYHVVTTAGKADGGELDAGVRRLGTVHVPSALHPIHGSDQKVQGHSFDVIASYDDENLYVYVDVEDDLLCAAKEKIEGRAKADHVRIYVDARKADRIGRGDYEDGVLNVAVYPPADEAAEPQVRASKDEAEVQAKLARTPVGYRVDCAIPWTVFSRTDGTPPVIGFDVVLNSYDADGNDQLGLSWTGRSGQNRNPGSFGKLLLV
jgi:predicted aldo/keto reductase-like oxidoreductase